MHEVRRFLRFTLPGMASFGQLLLAVYLTNSRAIGDLITAQNNLKDILGWVAAAFVSSGVAGYVLTSSYHALRWRPFFSFLAIDHLSLVTKLISINKLVVTDSEGDPIRQEDLNKRDAWTIVTYYWYANLEQSKQLAGLNTVTDRLVDFTHSHGATFLGTLVGLAVWFFGFSGFSRFNPSMKDLLLLGYWFVLLAVYGASQRLANRALEFVANAGVLSRMGDVGKFPVIVPFLRKPKCKKTNDRTIQSQ